MAEVVDIRERLAVVETKMAHIGSMLEHTMTIDRATADRLNLIASGLGRTQDSLVRLQQNLDHIYSTQGHLSKQLTQLGRQLDLCKQSDKAAQPKPFAITLPQVIEIAKWAAALLILTLAVSGKLSIEHLRLILGLL